jgi:hypothetical protein
VEKEGKKYFGSAPAAATAAPFTMAQLQSIGHGNIIASAAGQQYEVSCIVRCVVLSIFPLFFANILSHLLAYISGTILIAVFVCCIGSTSSSLWKLQDSLLFCLRRDVNCKFPRLGGRRSMGLSMKEFLCKKKLTI